MEDSTIAQASKTALTTRSPTTHQILVTELILPSIFSS